MTICKKLSAMQTYSKYFVVCTSNYCPQR